MLYVDRRSLKVHFADVLPKGAIEVPTDPSTIAELRNPLVRHTYFGGVNGAILTEREAGPKPTKKPAHKLPVPDPWLVAVTAIMWEGILQGLTWDAVKALVGAALTKLRARRLAPAQGPSTAREHGKGTVEVGFRYQEYATDTGRQRELFIGFRRQYDRMKEIDRLEPTRPLEWEKMRAAYIAERDSAGEGRAKVSPRMRRRK